MGFLWELEVCLCAPQTVEEKHRVSICELFYGGGEINQTPTSASENTFFTAVESTNHKLQYGGLNDPRRMIYMPVTVRSRRPLLRTFLPPLSSFPPAPSHQTLNCHSRRGGERASYDHG